MELEATDDDFLENDPRSCAAFMGPPQRLFLSKASTNDDDDSFCYPTSHTEWIEHYVMTEWENTAGIRCISMIVYLSSGTANTSSQGIDVDLDNDGNMLTISEVWSEMTQDMDIFYSKFEKHKFEEKDDYTQRQFTMQKSLRKLMMKYADTENKMVSVFRKQLPFRVEPTEMRVVFSGDKVGGRYCHIDLIEKKLQVLHEVKMMDDINNTSVPKSAKKQRYK